MLPRCLASAPDASTPACHISHSRRDPNLQSGSLCRDPCPCFRTTRHKSNETLTSIHGFRNEQPPVHGEGGGEGGEHLWLWMDAGMLCRAARPPASRTRWPPFSNRISIAALHGCRCWFAGLSKRIPGPSNANGNRLLTSVLKGLVVGYIASPASLPCPGA